MTGADIERLRITVKKADSGFGDADRARAAGDRMIS
jgi:hypothetical protein